MANAFTEAVCVVAGLLCAEPDAALEQEDTGTVPPDFYYLPDEVAPPPPPSLARLEVGSSLFFSPVILGGKRGFSAASLPISNLGETPYEVSSLVISGSAEFKILSTCATVPAKGSCNVQLRFSPVAAGNYQAELAIAGNGEPVRIALSGLASQKSLPPVASATEPETRPVEDQQTPAVKEDPARVALFRAISLSMKDAIPNGEVVNAPGVAVESILLARVDPGVPDWHLGDPQYKGRKDDGSFDGDVSSFPVERCRIVPRDAMIRVVLDFELNTQIGGRVRAHADRDVYGPDGRIKLIPWGTKFIGEFEPLEADGSTKVEILWSRMTRDDGAAIALQKTAAHDIMGRPGLVGDVDNRFLEKYGTVLATSGIAALVAAGTTSGTSDDGGTDSLTAAGQALQQSLAQVTADALREGVNLAPRITIPAGTVAYVVPGNDWYFPNAYEMVELDASDVTYTFGCSDEPFRYRNGIEQNS